MNPLKIISLLGLAIAMIGCTSSTPAVIVATPKDPPKGDVMYMTALQRQARFVIEHDCVRLRSQAGGNYLAVFPYGFSIIADSSGHTILDSEGRSWVRIGVPRDVGGGGVPTIDAKRFSPEISKCPGPYYYWIVSP